jgi:hypothetical protein
MKITRHRGAALLAILLVVQAPLLSGCPAGETAGKVGQQVGRNAVKRVGPAVGGGVIACDQSDKC